MFDEHPVEEVGREGRTAGHHQARGAARPLGRRCPSCIKSGSGGLLVPRGVRARPRGGPHLEGQLGVHRTRRPAGRQPGRHPRRRRHLRPELGQRSRSTTRAGPTQRNVLIEDGVLTDYMWDYLRARKEGRASSGNGRRQSYQDLPMVRMTNTFLLAGDEDPDEIVAQTPHGVYVAQLGGGQVNTATGDFVFGMTEAYLIEDGRITEPLRNANLIGNGPDVLSKIDAIGNDFDMCAGYLRQGRAERPRRLRPADAAGDRRHDRWHRKCLSSSIWPAGLPRRPRRARRSRSTSPAVGRPRSGSSKAASSSSPPPSRPASACG